MRAVLTRVFPEHGILGEEFGLERPQAPLRWVLDPIDGTRAFITGRPVFGTLLALLQDDRPVLGIIDQPVTGERWIGAAGRRTRFRGRFGGRPGCRPCARLDHAELSCTSPEMFDPADLPAWQRSAASSAADQLRRRLLRLRLAGAGPDRRHRRGDDEPVGLGGIGSGDRRCRRPADRLARPAARSVQRRPRLGRGRCGTAGRSGGAARPLDRVSPKPAGPRRLGACCTGFVCLGTVGRSWLSWREIRGGR